MLVGTRIRAVVATLALSACEHAPTPTTRAEGSANPEASTETPLPQTPTLSATGSPAQPPGAAPTTPTTQIASGAANANASATVGGPSNSTLPASPTLPSVTTTAMPSASQVTGAGGTASVGMNPGDTSLQAGADAGRGETGAESRDAGAEPGVRIVGRTAPGADGATKFAWAGVSFRARFRGTQVAMEVDDGNNGNRFSVVIDESEPKTVTSPSGRGRLQLATGLPDAVHDLTVWRNTEAAMGVTSFFGLSDFAELLAAPAAQARRIEVIGDSLSVGAGVLGTSTSCSPNIDAFTDNYLAYGSVAARALDADVVTIAWSGIGVYRSYSASDPTMPQRYDYAVPNEQTPWDFAQYEPDVVVFNLGTNDFGSGNPGQPYVDAYVAFIEHVRTEYPAAKFVLIDMYGGERADAIQSSISALNAAGEQDVEMLSFSSVPNNNTACNQHPNAAAQRAMGEILSARLKTLMSW